MAITQHWLCQTCAEDVSTSANAASHMEANAGHKMEIYFTDE